MALKESLVSAASYASAPRAERGQPWSLLADKRLAKNERILLKFIYPLGKYLTCKWAADGARREPRPFLPGGIVAECIAKKRPGQRGRKDKTAKTTKKTTATSWLLILFNRDLASPLPSGFFV